jgi:hypothetical protein
MGFVTYAAACCQCPHIDIKPGSDPNSINLRSQGVIAVALLTHPDGFNAVLFADPATITFGPNHATPVHPGGHIEDVDNDGDMDRLFHFNTQETGIQPGDTEATLYGTTFGGSNFQASDDIRTVPPH